MSLADFSHIADSLTPLTDYVYLHVMGEPLTHPDLCDFISTASAKGLKVAITTNGTLLKRRGRELISSSLYKVNISVHSFEDGDDESYYSYLSEIADFAELASSYGILTVLRLWNEGCDEGRNGRTLSYLEERLPYEWKWGARGARIRHKLHLEYGERFEWPDPSATDNGDGVFCYGLSDHFGILCDGTVIPCCLDREGVIALGNALTDDLSSILTSERVVKIREGFKQRCAVEELCRRCGYATRFK